MYSWELDQIFKAKNYYFSFYEFYLLQNNSPQIRYNLLWENNNEKCLYVWSLEDDYSWEIHILIDKY